MEGRRRALLSVPFGYASLHCEQGTPIPLANDLQLFNFRWQSLFKFGWQWTHEKTGISIFTISQFENGKGQGLSLSHFLLLLDAVGLDISLTNLIPIASVIDPEKIWKSQNRKGGRK